MAMSDEEAQNRVLAGQSGGTILSLRLRMSCLFVVCVRVWWVGIVAAGAMACCDFFLSSSLWRACRVVPCVCGGGVGFGVKVRDSHTRVYNL